MLIRTVFFTSKGEQTARLVFDGWEEYRPSYRQGDLKEWVKDSFEKHLPILFVGACGIAVRHIAPYVSDKLTDSPVLVMDEGGSFVIPILSGHLGGANELARIIAKRTGSQAVITTATDVNHLFAADVFAVKNHLAVQNREGIRAVSSKLLAGEKISVCIDRKEISLDAQPPEYFSVLPYPPADTVDVLIMDPTGAAADPEKRLLCQGAAADPERRLLYQEAAADPERKALRQEPKTDEKYRLLLTPRTLVVGMGCRKGKSFEELKAFLLRTMQANGITESMLQKKLFAIASIDVKKDEEGLMMLAQYFHVPFYTYSSEQLQQVEGDFTESSFVRSMVGVSNVCERAALCAAGAKDAESLLILRKQAENGMTIAAAKRKGRIQIWGMEE